MGRKLSVARRAAYIAEWRQDLRDANLQQVRGSAQRHAFSRLLGYGPTPVTPQLEKRIAKGLKSYLVALAADRSAVGPGEYYVNVDAWIDTNLLREGGDLLASTAQRASRLARLRDRKRRSNALTEKRSLLQIELTAERRETLRVLARKFGTRTLRETVAALIDSTVGKAPVSTRRATKVFTPKDGPDLLSAIECDKPP